MAMSRKNYVATAKIFAAAMNRNSLSGTSAEANARAEIRELCGDIASMFAADNPNFDRTRFLDACGML